MPAAATAPVEVCVKQFVCGDVVPDCPETFQAEQDDHILRAVRDHARRDHGLDELPPALLLAIRQQIRAVTG